MASNLTIFGRQKKYNLKFNIGWTPGFLENCLLQKVHRKGVEQTTHGNREIRTRVTCSDGNIGADENYGNSLV